MGWFVSEISLLGVLFWAFSFGRSLLGVLFLVLSFGRSLLRVLFWAFFFDFLFDFLFWLSLFHVSCRRYVARRLKPRA